MTDDWAWLTAATDEWLETRLARLNHEAAQVRAELERRTNPRTLPNV